MKRAVFLLLAVLAAPSVAAEATATVTAQTGIAPAAAADWYAAHRRSLYRAIDVTVVRELPNGRFQIKQPLAGPDVYEVQETAEVTADRYTVTARMPRPAGRIAQQHLTLTVDARRRLTVTLRLRVDAALATPDVLRGVVRDAVRELANYAKANPR